MSIDMAGEMCGSRRPDSKVYEYLGLYTDSYCPVSQEGCVGRRCSVLLRMLDVSVCHQLRKVPLCDEPPLSIDKQCTDLCQLHSPFFLPPNS